MSVYDSKVRDVALPVVDFREMTLVKGKGVWVEDTQGASYLDLNSGQFCGTFGHSYAPISEIFGEITSEFQDTDTSTLSVQALRGLSAIRTRLEGMDQPKGILLSTGAEAGEFALRYAKHLTEREGVASFDRGYHGLTLGTAAYSMSRTRTRPVVPASFSVKVPVNHEFSSENGLQSALEELDDLFFNHGTQISCFIAEPILSGGGVVFPSRELLKAVRQKCDEYGSLLIFDECQTGMGRLGTWFGFQELGIRPDMVILGKALGGGYPVASVFMDSRWVPSNGFLMKHFSSHQNEPFAGRLVEFIFEHIESNNILENVRRRGEQLGTGLSELQTKYPNVVREPRGMGLFWGFDTESGVDEFRPGSSSAQLLIEVAEKNGLLLQSCNFNRTVRILPPLNVTIDEINEFLRRLRLSIESL